MSPWEIHFFLAEIAVYTNLQWAKPGRKPGWPAGGGTLTYRRSSPGPGTSYVHGGIPPDLVWVA
jgi:hypothetical protein